MNRKNRRAAERLGRKSATSQRTLDQIGTVSTADLNRDQLRILCEYLLSVNAILLDRFEEGYQNLASISPAAEELRTKYMADTAHMRRKNDEAIETLVGGKLQKNPWNV